MGEHKYFHRGDFWSFEKWYSPMVSVTTPNERIVSLVLAVRGCYNFWSLRTTNYGFVCTNLFSLFSSLFSHLGWHSTGEKVILVRTGDHRDDTEFEASSARFSHVCKILHNLEGFYLADSCFFPRSPSLWQLSHLTSLYLNNNNLMRIPPDISRLENLSFLDLSYNKLRSLPAELGDLANLRELFLSHNYLRVLPYELGKLFQLQVS